MNFLRYGDLILLAVALPVFVIAGWPMLGYAGGAFAWIAQRGIQAWTNNKAVASDNPARVAGIVTGSMIGRGWLVALTIFGVGMIENDAGLAAAVLFIVVFTAYFTLSMATRPFDQADAGRTS
ncbi:MAG: hypothetical protein F2813_05320 [Actinobacteria bacterium]|uniref:Unannotated protein n=1 Tax=freshwater metagenome TaxID=449393 RepID=A0A6J5ZUR5_9ZZZZ|nr:hypothetical protein [Actinomycetota bacterium]